LLPGPGRQLIAAAAALRASVYAESMAGQGRDTERSIVADVRLQTGEPVLPQGQAHGVLMGTGRVPQRALAALEGRLVVRALSSRATGRNCRRGSAARVACRPLTSSCPGCGWWRDVSRRRALSMNPRMGGLPTAR
jgi:hypothetical protein